MLRVAQGAPSRRERSNCGADEWTHSSNLACRPRMSKHCQECAAPRPGVRAASKVYRQSQSLARGQANKTSADGRDCESALGGKADTPFAGKAERTAKVAIEERYECLACCRRTKALHAGPLQDTKPGTADRSVDWLPYRPGTGVSSAGRPLQCCCQNGVGMPTCPEVLKEPSRRRRCQNHRVINP